VQALFDFRPRGPIAMKGKLAPVESYEVLGVKAAPGKTRGLKGLESQLVGRDREIALLKDRFSALQSGTGSVVAVIGEAGLGKSRLVAELRNFQEQEGGERAAWLESRA